MFYRKPEVQVVCRFKPVSKEESGHYVDSKLPPVCVVFDEQNVEVLDRVYAPNFIEGRAPKMPSENAKKRDTLRDLSKTFTLDSILSDKATQEQLYARVGYPIVKNVVKGYNGTVLAYGQTGSGKTHSMLGPEGGTLDVFNRNSELYSSRGLIPRMVEDLFKLLEAMNASERSWSVKVSIFEIYKEDILDLMGGKKKTPAVPQGAKSFRIREDVVGGKGIYIEAMEAVPANSAEELLSMIKSAMHRRKTAVTNFNETSSRSHSLVCINVDQVDRTASSDGVQIFSRLNLVDLAGSEKVYKTLAAGERLKEAQMINLSLTLLGNVIYKLTDGKSGYVPYRDSKLTRILQESLGGNSITTLVCHCSIAMYNREETLSTLRFAQRAKRVKNKPRVNRELTNTELKLQLAAANQTIEVLKQKIQLNNELLGQQRNKNEECDAEMQSILDSLMREIEDLREELQLKEEELCHERDRVDFYRKEAAQLEQELEENRQRAKREKELLEDALGRAQGDNARLLAQLRELKRDLPEGLGGHINNNNNNNGSWTPRRTPRGETRDGTNSPMPAHLCGLTSTAAAAAAMEEQLRRPETADKVIQNDFCGSFHAVVPLGQDQDLLVEKDGVVARRRLVRCPDCGHLLLLPAMRSQATMTVLGMDSPALLEGLRELTEEERTASVAVENPTRPLGSDEVSRSMQVAGQLLSAIAAPPTTNNNNNGATAADESGAAADGAEAADGGLPKDEQTMRAVEILEQVLNVITDAVQRDEDRQKQRDDAAAATANNNNNNNPAKGLTAEDAEEPHTELQDALQISARVLQAWRKSDGTLTPAQLIEQERLAQLELRKLSAPEQAAFLEHEEHLVAAELDHLGRRLQRLVASEEERAADKNGVLRGKDIELACGGEKEALQVGFGTSFADVPVATLRDTMAGKPDGAQFNEDQRGAMERGVKALQEEIQQLLAAHEAELAHGLVAASKQEEAALSAEYVDGMQKDLAKMMEDLRNTATEKIQQLLARDAPLTPDDLAGITAVLEARAADRIEGMNEQQQQRASRHRRSQGERQLRQIAARESAKLAQGTQAALTASVEQLQELLHALASGEDEAARAQNAEAVNELCVALQDQLGSALQESTSSQARATDEEVQKLVERADEVSREDHAKIVAKLVAEANDELRQMMAKVQVLAVHEQMPAEVGGAAPLTAEQLQKLAQELESLPASALSTVAKAGMSNNNYNNGGVSGDGRTAGALESGETYISAPAALMVALTPERMERLSSQLQVLVAEDAATGGALSASSPNTSAARGAREDGCDGGISLPKAQWTHATRMSVADNAKRQLAAGEWEDFVANSKQFVAAEQRKGAMQDARACTVELQRMDRRQDSLGHEVIEQLPNTLLATTMAEQETLSDPQKLLVEEGVEELALTLESALAEQREMQMMELQSVSMAELQRSAASMERISADDVENLGRALQAVVAQSLQHEIRALEGPMTAEKVDEVSVRLEGQANRIIAAACAQKQQLNEKEQGALVATLQRAFVNHQETTKQKRQKVVEIAMAELATKLRATANNGREARQGEVATPRTIERLCAKLHVIASQELSRVEQKQALIVSDETARLRAEQSHHATLREVSVMSNLQSYAQDTIQHIVGRVAMSAACATDPSAATSGGALVKYNPSCSSLTPYTAISGVGAGADMSQLSEDATALQLTELSMASGEVRGIIAEEVVACLQQAQLASREGVALALRIRAMPTPEKERLAIQVRRVGDRGTLTSPSQARRRRASEAAAAAHAAGGAIAINNTLNSPNNLGGSNNNNNRSVPRLRGVVAEDVMPLEPTAPMPVVVSREQLHDLAAQIDALQHMENASLRGAPTAEVERRQSTQLPPCTHDELTQLTAQICTLPEDEFALLQRQLVVFTRALMPLEEQQRSAAAALTSVAGYLTAVQDAYHTQVTDARIDSSIDPAKLNMALSQVQRATLYAGEEDGSTAATSGRRDVSGIITAPNRISAYESSNMGLSATELRGSARSQQQQQQQQQLLQLQQNEELSPTQLRQLQQQQQQQQAQLEGPASRLLLEDRKAQVQQEQANCLQALCDTIERARGEEAEQMQQRPFISMDQPERLLIEFINEADRNNNNNNNNSNALALRAGSENGVLTASEAEAAALRSEARNLRALQAVQVVLRNSINEGYNSSRHEVPVRDATMAVELIVYDTERTQLQRRSSVRPSPPSASTLVPVDEDQPQRPVVLRGREVSPSPPNPANTAFVRGANAHAHVQPVEVSEVMDEDAQDATSVPFFATLVEHYLAQCPEVVEAVSVLHAATQVPQTTFNQSFCSRAMSVEEQQPLEEVTNLTGEERGGPPLAAQQQHVGGLAGVREGIEQRTSAPRMEVLERRTSGQQGQLREDGDACSSKPRLLAHQRHGASLSEPIRTERIIVSLEILEEAVSAVLAANRDHVLNPYAGMAPEEVQLVRRASERVEQRPGAAPRTRVHGSISSIHAERVLLATQNLHLAGVSEERAGLSQSPARAVDASMHESSLAADDDYDDDDEAAQQQQQLRSRGGSSHNLSNPRSRSNSKIMMKDGVEQVGCSPMQVHCATAAMRTMVNEAQRVPAAREATQTEDEVVWRVLAREDVQEALKALEQCSAEADELYAGPVVVKQPYTFSTQRSHTRGAPVQVSEALALPERDEENRRHVRHAVATIDAALHNLPLAGRMKPSIQRVVEMVLDNEDDAMAEQRKKKRVLTRLGYAKATNDRSTMTEMMGSGDDLALALAAAHTPRALLGTDGAPSSSTAEVAAYREAVAEMLQTFGAPEDEIAINERQHPGECLRRLRREVALHKKAEEPLLRQEVAAKQTELACIRDTMMEVRRLVEEAQRHGAEEEVLASENPRVQRTRSLPDVFRDMVYATPNTPRNYEKENGARRSSSSAAGRPGTSGVLTEQSSNRGGGVVGRGGAEKKLSNNNNNNNTSSFMEENNSHQLVNGKLAMLPEIHLEELQRLCNAHRAAEAAMPSNGAVPQTEVERKAAEAAGSVVGTTEVIVQYIRQHFSDYWELYRTYEEITCRAERLDELLDKSRNDRDDSKQELDALKLVLDALRKENDNMRYVLRDMNVDLEEYMANLAQQKKINKKLKAEADDLKGKAAALSTTAQQQEFCEMGAMELLMKNEDMSAIEKSLEEVQYFCDEDLIRKKRAMLAKGIKAIGKFCEKMLAMLQSQPRFNTGTLESQRLNLLQGLAELLGRIDDAHEELNTQVERQRQGVAR